MPSFLYFVSHKLELSAFIGVKKCIRMSIAQTIVGALMISFNSIGPATLQNSMSEGVVSSGRRGVSLGRLGDHLRGDEQNMCGSAQEAAIGRTIGAFKDNEPRRYNNFEDTILVVILEVHYLTDADSGGSSVTKRHFWRKEAEIGKGRRKMVSLLGSCVAYKKEFAKELVKFKKYKAVGLRSKGRGSMYQWLFLRKYKSKRASRRKTSLRWHSGCRRWYNGGRGHEGGIKAKMKVGLITNRALVITPGKKKFEALGASMVRNVVKSMKVDQLVHRDGLQAYGALVIKGAMMTPRPGRSIII